MSDQKATQNQNGVGNSQSQKELDPLAELQRILANDDPFRVFDKIPKFEMSQRVTLKPVRVEPETKTEVKAEPISAPAQALLSTAQSVDDLEQQLKSLAKDIEQSFQNTQISEPVSLNRVPRTTQSPLDLDEDIVQHNQGELFVHETPSISAGLRGGIDEAPANTVSEVAETIRAFDQHNSGAWAQNERRDFAPLFADDTAPIPSATHSLSGYKVLIAVLITAVLGIGGLALLSSQSQTAQNDGDIPVIKADEKPSKFKPLDVLNKDQAPQTTMFNKDAAGQASEGSKIVEREEKPLLKENLPTQSGKDTLQMPVKTSVDSKENYIQPNNAAKIFGQPKKVKPLAVGADGKVIIEGASQAQAIGVESGVRPSVFMGGVRVPQARPDGAGLAQKTESVSPIISETQKQAVVKPATKSIGTLVQEKTTNTVVIPPSVAANSGQPIALNDTAAQKTAAAGYIVQLTAQRSEQGARAAFADLQKRHSSILAGLKPLIVPIDLGDKGIYYRVRLGQYSTRDAAQNICSRLKADGGDCLVQPN